jgi:hypothetical protein
MARAKKKYHYIYKTTCNVTGKFYIGMHSTVSLEDGYMGSGKRLRYSIRKHGVENHTKEILEFLPDRESLVKREADIVNEQFIQDSLCMNLKPGGRGGFISIENQRKRSMCGNTKLKELLKDSSFKAKWIQSIRDSGVWDNGTFNGKFHTECTKEKMRAKAKERIGHKNSQFGTCWITNEIENKKIKKDDLIPNGWRLGRKF